MERDEPRVDDFGQFGRQAVRARKCRKPALSQNHDNRDPMLERDLIPVPLQHQGRAETAGSLARLISGSESIIVIALGAMLETCGSAGKGCTFPVTVSSLKQ